MYAAAEYLMVLQEAVKARLNRQARRARREEEPFQPLDEEWATKKQGPKPTTERNEALYLLR